MAENQEFTSPTQPDLPVASNSAESAGAPAPVRRRGRPPAAAKASRLAAQKSSEPTAPTAFAPPSPAPAPTPAPPAPAAPPPSAPAAEAGFAPAPSAASPAPRPEAPLTPPAQAPYANPQNGNPGNRGNTLNNNNYRHHNQNPRHHGPQPRHHHRDRNERFERNDRDRRPQPPQQPQSIHPNYDDGAELDARDLARGGVTYSLADLQAKTMTELTQSAIELNIEGVGTLDKHDIIFAILKASTEKSGLIYGGGCLEVLPDGFGFLRLPEFSFKPCPEDIYMSPSQIRRFSLRTGDTVMGSIRAPREKERFFAMLKVDSVNGQAPELKKNATPFESQTAYFPTKRLPLEVGPGELSTRVLDLVTPLGRGQRGLIIAPPRTGKTMLLQKIANSITANSKDVDLIVLLIDERPEEITDMKRNVKGEILSTTFDEPAERHIQVAELACEKAKRLVEIGRHVVILLDSLTRLARACSSLDTHAGRAATATVSEPAIHKPKRFFSAARNLENGGSLTILATVLIETGSKQDDAMYEDFKGTGNLEVILDRQLADKRVFPAINIEKSGTRKEELLLRPDELERVWALRRVLNGIPANEAMELLLSKLKKTRNNVEFLMSLQV